MKLLIPSLALGLGLFTGTTLAEPAPLRLADNAVTVQDLLGGPQDGISLDQAVKRVKRETGGRILSAKTVKKDGVTIHRVKVLTPDNRVIVYEIDR